MNKKKDRIECEDCHCLPKKLYIIESTIRKMDSHSSEHVVESICRNCADAGVTLVSEHLREVGDVRIVRRIASQMNENNVVRYVPYSEYQQLVEIVNQ